MSKKLSQVLAVEKGVKVRTYAAVNEMHKAAQTAALFNGQSRTYEPIADGGVPQPAQNQKVQRNAEEMFAEAQKILVDLFDVTATKDWGNQNAKADLVVDGQKLLSDVPATYFLFLDKQLSDLRDMVSKCTELDAAVDWTKDPNSGLFKSTPIQTQTTQKVQEALVKYPATDKHPAQTEMITVDRVVGQWTTVKQSGALPVPRKKQLLDRIQKLLDAVKIALEDANSTSVDNKHAGASVLGYIFA